MIELTTSSLYTFILKVSLLSDHIYITNKQTQNLKKIILKELPKKKKKKKKKKMQLYAYSNTIFKNEELPKYIYFRGIFLFCLFIYLFYLLLLFFFYYYFFFIIYYFFYLFIFLIYFILFFLFIIIFIKMYFKMRWGGGVEPIGCCISGCKWMNTYKNHGINSYLFIKEHPFIDQRYRSS